MHDDCRNWCLCGAPYELLRCVYASSKTSKWYWYCFSCGSYEAAEGISDSNAIKKEQRSRNNGKEYRGAL